MFGLAVALPVVLWLKFKSILIFLINFIDLLMHKNVLAKLVWILWKYLQTWDDRFKKINIMDFWHILSWQHKFTSHTFVGYSKGSKNFDCICYTFLRIAPKKTSKSWSNSNDPPSRIMTKKLWALKCFNRNFVHFSNSSYLSKNTKHLEEPIELYFQILWRHDISMIKTYIFFVFHF